MLCKPEIFGWRTELVSSVLASLGNPGRRRNRDCRRRGSHIHLLWKTLLVRHFQRKLSYALLSFEIMCPIKFELRQAPLMTGQCQWHYGTLICTEAHWSPTAPAWLIFRALIFPVAFCNTCVCMCVLNEEKETETRRAECVEYKELLVKTDYFSMIGILNKSVKRWTVTSSELQALVRSSDLL